MKKIFFVLSLFGSFMLTSCSTGIRGTYISGYAIDISSPTLISEAYYLKDGAKEIVSGDKLAVATSIFVTSSSVYLSGLYMDATATHMTACYWKDGEIVALDSNDNDANTTGIYVHGEDVYVSGFYTDSVTSKFVAVYWKNGVLHELGTGTGDSLASAITVSDGDVYVAGNDDANNAVYWKNGTAVVVEASNAMISAIQVVGTDVYTAGNWDEGPGPQAVYWKNTTVTRLEGGVLEALASSIQVVGTDVYVAGLYNDLLNVAYWKNGTRTDLALDSAYIPAGPESGFFNGLPIILVNGTDVHVLCLLAEGTTNFFSGHWLNGAFTKAEDNNAYSGIFIKSDL